MERERETFNAEYFFSIMKWFYLIFESVKNIVAERIIGFLRRNKGG